MTLKTVRSALYPDTASIKNGIFTVRWWFFYRSGGSAEKCTAQVKATFPTATILEAEEVWKPFRGGASTAQQSHWFVKFTV